MKGCLSSYLAVHLFPGFFYKHLVLKSINYFLIKKGKITKKTSLLQNYFLILGAGFYTIKNNALIPCTDANGGYFSHNSIKTIPKLQIST